MDPQTYMDVATVVTKLKMYPYFDVAHYTLMCVAVKEDQPSQQGGSSPQQPFSRRHPLSSWISSMLICFAGGIVANLLLGEPLIAPFKDHQSILTATICWYLVNYSPFDLVYKLVKLLPCYLALSILKETQRAHKVYHGVLVAAKLYPSSYLVIIIIGTIKGAGSGIMKSFDRLIRGIWIPGSNEVLQPTFATKACLVAAIVFLCERLNFIAVPHPLIYFGIVLFFVYFKISSVVLGIHDPFVPLENLFCAVFMGGMWDALRRASTKAPSKEESKDPHAPEVKSKDEKKKD